MILQILSEESLLLLKDKICIEKNMNKYKNYSSNEWIKELCGTNGFIDTKYKNLPELKFDMSAPKRKEYETEFANVKMIYDNLRFLSDSNASDERLWAALCVGEGYDYVRYRWNPQTESSVIQHFFFDRNKSSARRVLTRNAISRLWWIGRLTYDKDNKADPYELTRFVCEHPDYIMHLIERNTSNNIHILRPFIKGIMEAHEKGYNLNTDDVGELAKYLNLLGGTHILDFMSEEWIKEKISNRIEEIVSANSLSEKDIINQESKKRVSSDSKVVIKANNPDRKMIISVKKNKLKTNPVSIIGLKINDKIRIGKIDYTIVDIK